MRHDGSAVLRHALFGPAVALAVLSADGGITQNRSLEGPEVSIVFRASSEAGDAIRDLPVESLTLTVGGRTRQIRSFQAVAYSPGEAPPLTSKTSASPFGTNIGSPAKELTLLIDADAIPPGSAALLREAVDGLLGGMSKDDRVGLVTIGRSQVRVGPTARHDRIRSAVESLTLRGSALCRVQDVAGRLVDLVGNWSVDVPPAVVAFSAVSTMSPTRTGDYCPLPKHQLVYLETAATASAGGVSVVQVPNQYGEITPNSGLSALSLIFGGKPIVLSTRGSTASMRQLLSRTSSYYRMTFLPDAAEYDGRDRPVDVRTTQSQVKLHFRSSVGFPDAEHLLDPATVLPQHGGYSRLQLRAAFFLGASGDNVKVVTVFDSDATADPLAAAVIGIFDEEGQLIARWTAEEAELTRTPTSAALVVAPGNYRLRVVGVDRRGDVGTIDSDFEAVLDKAGPGRVSSLAAGVLEDGVFSPKLQFGSEATVVGQFELYGLPPLAAVSATFTLLQRNHSEPLVARPGIIDVPPDGGLGLVQAELPIRTLQPGDYVLRAAVTLNGEQIADLVRTIRKSH
ncbi:MAG: hypothetical protein WD227_05115 [Vicinamibacterales bacterium]